MPVFGINRAEGEQVTSALSTDTIVIQRYNVFTNIIEPRIISLGNIITTQVFAWTVTTTAVALEVNNGYVANSGSLITFTLPTAAAVGDIIRIANYNTGGWRIDQNVGQSMRYGTAITTTGTAGYLASQQQGDVFEVLCVVENTGWQLLGSLGNITII
jgi:hypothetical protein